MELYFRQCLDQFDFSDQQRVILVGCQEQSSPILALFVAATA
jgi:hypothetical protein